MSCNSSLRYIWREGRGVLKKGLYGEAPPGGPIPYPFLLYTGKYTTNKIHKNYIRDPNGLFSIHTWVYRWRNFGNFPPKFVGVLRPLNFSYTFFKAFLIFCHCRALFSSVLFLKIIVNNVLYCCTVNLSRDNYF